MESITKSRSFTVWTRPLLNDENTPGPIARSLADKARELAGQAGSTTRKLASDLKSFAGRKMQQQPASKRSSTVRQIMQEKRKSGSASTVRNEEEATVMGAMMRWVAVPLVLLLAFIAYFQLSEQVKDLRSAVSSLDNDLGTARMNIAALSEHNGVLQQEKAKLIDERSQLQSLVAGLETDLASERATVSKLNGDLMETKQTLKSTIARFETRVNALEGINESQKSMISVRDELIGSLESDMKARDARIASQVETIFQNKETIASLQDDLAGEAKVNETLRAKASGLRDDLNRAFDKIDTLGKEVAAAAKVADAMAVRSSKLEETLAASYAQTEELEREKSIVENRLSRIHGILASTEPVTEKEPETQTTEAASEVASDDSQESASRFPVPAKRTGVDLISFRKLVSFRNR